MTVVRLEPIYESVPSGDRYSGVRALWIKVMIRAVFDWVNYRDAIDIRQRKLAEQAFAWIFRPNDMFNSFENLCFYLDVSPDRVRVWARNLSPDQVAKIEHLDRWPTPEEVDEELEGVLEDLPKRVTGAR